LNNLNKKPYIEKINKDGPNHKEKEKTYNIGKLNKISHEYYLNNLKYTLEHLIGM